LSWIPPTTFSERIKRAIFNPRQELKRVIARELRKGEPELRLLPDLVDPKRAAVDVGANRGVWTHQMAALCPRVYAFEPNPKMFAILDAARPSNAEARQIALSDRTGMASLKVPRSARGFSNQHASLETNWAGAMEFGVVEVATARLDELGLEPVGFIKIDVEGFELQVVKGLSQPIEMISLEYTPELTFNLKAAIEHLETLANYEFNLSWCESMVMSRSKWFDKEKLFQLMDSMVDEMYLFGDIYIKKK
jgi:FkbM family methyltransferase